MGYIGENRLRQLWQKIKDNFQPKGNYATKEYMVEYIDDKGYITLADVNPDQLDISYVEKSAINGNVKINGTETVVYTHPIGTNPHGTTKEDIGMGSVDNTADKDKVVASAAKLTSGRTFQTDLSSNAAKGFTGEENNIHGVTGVLPMEHGGTGNTNGAALSAITDKNGNDITETYVTIETFNNDFILKNNESIIFADGVCIISDNRITANSLADVYFASSSYDMAVAANIIPETSAGKLTLTAKGTAPAIALVASIRIRVV